MRRERGQAFILVLILLAVGALLIIPFLEMTSTALKGRQMYGQFIKEDYAADAVVEYGMWLLQWEPGFAESLPVGTESDPFVITLNGVNATGTILAQATPGDLSGQALGGRADDELFFKVTKTVVASATYQTIASDGFESHSASGGTGDWNGNWILSGDYFFSTSGEYEGSYHLRLRGDDNQTPGDGYAQRSVDLSSSTGQGPFLTFWARVDSFESGDTAEARVSTDGANWDILRVFTYADSDGRYRMYQYDLSSYGTPADFYLSFRTALNSSYDSFYIDNIYFSNAEETTVIEPGVVIDYTYYVNIQCMDPDGCTGYQNLDRIYDILPDRNAPSGDYLQYIIGSTDWDEEEWGVPPFDPYRFSTGSYGSYHQELEWDFEDASYEDIDFDYGEIKTMNFKARAALTEGVYCNEIRVSTSSSGWDTDEIVDSTTAKIIVGEPEDTNCSGGLLSVTKTADPIVLYPNQETTVTYNITIENVDTVPRRIYQIEDWLPTTGSAAPEESFVYVENSAYGYITPRSYLPVLFYDDFSRPDSDTVSYWTDSDGSGSNVAINSNSVRLRIPSGTHDGNQFLVEATSSIGDMTSSSVKTDLRFTAQSNQTVTKIRVYLQTEAGASPSYRYGLRANSGGDPSSNWLGATQHGYGDLTATTTGWQTITLNESVSLTAGTVYHIVVQPQGTPSTSNYIALRRSTPQNNMLPYDGASDPNSNTRWWNGFSWTTQNYQPIYLLETATPTYEGNPCETTTAQSVYGANYNGEKLTISGGEQQVTAIGFYVRKNSSTTPADDLRYQIRDSTDAVVRSGTLVTKTAITTSYNWYDASLSSPLTLTDGATYRVNLYSPGSTSSYYYQVLRNDNTDNAAYNGRNYNGTGSVYCSSTDSSSSWTNSNQYDIPFRLTTIPDVSITQYNISTVGYTGIVFSYSYWRGGYSGTDPQLKVEWKPNSSGTWNTLATHTLTSYSPTTPSWNLPAEANNTNIDIRFTDLTVSTREARVDNVEVTISVPLSWTPVCMPDENEGYYYDDFFNQYWHSDSQRWELDWNFSNYPGASDDVWDDGGLCEDYSRGNYDPYLELQPGEIFQVVFQATVTLTASGSYYDEVFVRISDEYYGADDWVYSWPTGGVMVPQYDIMAETLNSILRANALLTPQGHWWRSWHWKRHG